ncbi:GTPase HflX [Bacillus horti]|uniref:GTPase HflX n=1 Tax=Caldalkalibacillus horti TaxID=77523 RepID=A0ABT9VVD1_9BACI|nr:GTPase HflX [Bacillus horti]MDQ0164840.1 GTP-binding protein HflX [Bacillus horti]
MKETSNGKQEKAILIGCIVAQQTEEQVESSLKELSLLTETAKATPILTVTQKRDRVDSSFYIGKGKLEEICVLIDELGADMIIFNDELSPSQLKNIELSVPVKVIDRTQLILDIFAMRARSKEGQLQVELAQYKYLLPRIVGRGKSLSRLGGGIGTRGPGETKLETDRRHIRRRMGEIETALNKVVSHRERYRERRKKNNVFQISLVGYTNAGKSTLLNKITDADTYVENQLFATLDPTTKQMKMPSGIQVLLTDTVGFIQDLPTALIAAFRSTLEEVKEADLILHVIDSHDELHQKHIEVVEKLIQQLGAGHIAQVKVYNKKDKPAAEGLLVNQKDMYISTTSVQDVQLLRERIEDELKATMKELELFVPSEQAHVVAKCRQQGLIQDEEWNEERDGYEVTLFVPPHHSLGELIEPYIV